MESTTVPSIRAATPGALLMAVADGGVVRSLDDGKSYQRVSENWGNTTGLNSWGTAITSDVESHCVVAAHSARDSSYENGPCSVFQSCNAGDSWSLLGGWDGKTNGLGGLQIEGRIAHIAIDYTSPVAARRVLIGAGGGGGGGAVWLFESSTKTWSRILNTTSPIQFTAQGPHTFPDRPGVALLADVGRLFVLDLTTRRWSTVELVSPDMPAEATITALAASFTNRTSIRVMVGTRSVQGSPAVFTAEFNLGATVAHCTLSLDFGTQWALRGASRLRPRPYMRVSSVVMRGQTAAAGLQVGDYIDGDVPAHIWLSTDAGRHWQGVNLPNTVVASMRFDADGRLCISSNGDGMLCVVPKVGGSQPKSIPKSTQRYPTYQYHL